MTNDQLNILISELGIAADHILREEAEMILLNELAKDKLSAKLVFYGGTALRLAYNSPRFSEDIDLLIDKSVSFLEFKKFIAALPKKYPEWQVKDIKNKRQTMFALILIKEEKLKHNFSLKIEVHKPAKKVEMETRLILIKSRTHISEPLLLVPTIKQLKIFKELALMNRKKARDIFDLWYISQAAREDFILPDELPHYSEREFKNELQKFLPKNYYPIIHQLYGEINKKN